MRRARGGQTVVVIEQRNVRHGETADGARTSYPGCSVQPESAQEYNNREQRSEARYKLFAPPGFRAAATDKVEVTPGPVDDHGRPARLNLVGPAEPWFDGRGREDHVEAVLRRRTG